MGFTPRRRRDLIILLGETRDELSGSEWAWVTHEHLGGVPPQVDLARERALAEVIAEAARVGHITAAHDLSDGGLAQALVESCCAVAGARGSRCPDGSRSRSAPVLRVGRPGAGVRAPRAAEGLHRALRRARAALDADRHGRRLGQGSGHPRPVHHQPGRAARGPHVDPAAACSAPPADRPCRRPRHQSSRRTAESAVDCCRAARSPARVVGREPELRRMRPVRSDDAGRTGGRGRAVSGRRSRPH